MREICFSKQKPGNDFFPYTSILQYTQKLTLMICHRKLNTRWVVPFSRSSAPMLTVLQPMERAEFKASVRFSRNAVRSLEDFGLVMARSSTVSGTATLIILLKTKSISSLLSNFYRFENNSYWPNCPESLFFFAWLEPHVNVHDVTCHINIPWRKDYYIIFVWRLGDTKNILKEKKRQKEACEPKQILHDLALDSFW